MFFHMSRFGFAIVLFIAAGAGIFFLVRPAVSALQEAKRELVIAEVKVEYEQSILDAYTKLETGVNANAEQLALMEKALPIRREKPTATAELLLGIRDIAEREAGGVFLKSVGLQDLGSSALKKEETKSGVISQKVTISGIASYDALSRFLHALALSRRLLEPENVTFAPASEDGSVLNFQVAANAYLYQP